MSFDVNVHVVDDVIANVIDDVVAHVTDVEIIHVYGEEMHRRFDNKLAMDMFLKVNLAMI